MRAGWIAALWIGTAGLLAAGTAGAAVSEVTAEASPTRVDVGQAVTYRITVTGSGTLPTPTVNLPSAFQIISGPNSSMNMQFVNGRMSTTRSLSYVLRALRQGEHVIPSPQVRDRGEVTKGNAITISVTAPGAQQQQQTPPSAGTPGQSSRSTSPSPPAAQPRGADRPDIFLQVDVQPRSVVVQEPVVVTWTLFFQPQVRTFDVQRLASTEGFWSEEWPVPNPPNVQRRTVDGEAYNAATIHRLILFPTKAGELTVGPMDIVVQYHDPRGRRGMLDDFFDDPFFGGSMETKAISSPGAVVTVRSLPEQGRPEGFENVVGDFAMTASLDTARARVNDSVTLTVTLQGEGNVGFLPEPDVNTPPDIERYDPEVSESHEVRGGRVVGSKSFRYLLIPRRAGEQTIPEIEYSYYDPEAERYRTLRQGPLTLDVSGAGGFTAGPEAGDGGAPARVQTQATDIRWILDATRGLRREGPPLHERAAYWLAYLVPVAVLAGAWLIRRRRRSLEGRAGEIRSRRAAKRAMKALKQARERLAASDAEGGYNALARGLKGYLADRTGADPGELDEATRRRLFEAHGVSQAARQELEAILATCDSARFTPQGADAGALGELIERSGRWIGRVDKSFDRGRSGVKR